MEEHWLDKIIREQREAQGWAADLFEGAARAEELFELHELEDHAAAYRREKEHR